MIIAIMKTDNNSYWVNVQCDGGNRWTERVPEAELKSTVIRACSILFTISGDIPDDVRDTINKIAGSE